MLVAPQVTGNRSPTIPTRTLSARRGTRPRMASETASCVRSSPSRESRRRPRSGSGAFSSLAVRRTRWRTPAVGSRRGKDYNHSTDCDLIITGLARRLPRADDAIKVEPLLPDGTGDHLCLDGAPCIGWTRTVFCDSTGKKYDRRSGLRVLDDGEKTGASETLGRRLVPLPPGKGAFQRVTELG
jgi:hypothetical protein